MRKRCSVLLFTLLIALLGATALAAAPRSDPMPASDVTLSDGTAVGRALLVATGMGVGALLSMLFRETDRVQRMSTSLSLMLFEIDDGAHQEAHLGAADCEDLLRQAVGRVQRLLRSYDLFGRVGAAGFALGFQAART